MATVDPRMMAQVLRGFNPSPIVSQQPIPATSLARVKDTRLRNAQNMEQFNSPIISTSAGGGALAGVARGISKYLQQQRGDKDLEAAYGAYEAAERAQAQQVAQAEQAQAAAQREQALADEQRKRQEGREDKQWEWANKPPSQLSPQDVLQMQQTQAQIASIMQQMQLREAKDDREADKASRAAEEAAAVQTEQAAVRDEMAEAVKFLLSPEQAQSMDRATGSIDGRWIPTIRQGTKDWENKFNFFVSGLTSEKLDMMTGVLSESDMKVLREIAGGGIDLTSSRSIIEPVMQRFYEATTGEPLTYEQSGAPAQSLTDRASMAIGDAVDMMLGDSSVTVKRVK